MVAEKPTYEELERRVLELEKAEFERRKAEETLEKRTHALTTSSDDAANIAFEDLFNLHDIQCLQDEFAQATGVASMIMHLDGTPITRASNFCRLCREIIRKTEKGRRNCQKSDATIGDLSFQGLVIRPCFCAGLWDAGAGISVGGRHIANWMIGQVRDDTQTEDQIRACAREIGADQEAMVEAFWEVPSMSREQFEQIARMLFTLANQLSGIAYQNVQQRCLIAEQKRAKDSLTESETYLRTLIRTIPGLVWLKDQQGAYLFCNSRVESFFGAKEQDIIGKTDYDFVGEGLADFFRKNDKLAIAEGKPISNEEEVTFADDGHRGILETIKTPIYRNDGQLTGVLGIGRDITERKEAERERLANLHFFESMDKVNRAVQGASDPKKMMSYVLDVLIPIFDCDRAWLVFPCDPEAASWRVSMECARPEYPGALAEGGEIPMDAEVATAFRILRNSSIPLKFGPGAEYRVPDGMAQGFSVQSFIAIAIHPKIDSPYIFVLHQCSYPRVWKLYEEKLFQEIGRRLADGLTSLLMHRDLRNSKEFLNNIVENIPNMIFVKDAEALRFVRLNKAGEKLLGYSRGELLGKNDYDFFPTEEADFFTSKDREVLNTKKFVDIPEEEIKTRENDERILHTKKIPILDETGKSQYLLGISEDITEHKKLEAQLRQALKMESVGRLAGGVAHDFNNMLGVIIGHTDMALDQVDPTQPLFDDLQEIRTAAERSAALTQQLMAFARKQTVAPRVLDLNETVAGMLKMLRPLIGEDIDLAWLPELGVWPVRMDHTQVDQILANLCVNARDAITSVGRITIETENTTLDEAYCANHPGFVPGDFVQLAVSDDGYGMEKEILDNIFEPFFTTKGMGKGTGLGLATVYGIVKQNDGFINVYSEPGQGTTFKIYLPRHTAKVGQMRQENALTPAAPGNETILLVEDEPAILKMARLMLERFGYQVLAASTPGEAIRVASEHTGDIHLLLSDVVMPEMNGRDLAKNLISLYPEIKRLFMSGYTDSVIAHHGVVDEGINFIQKPFPKQSLAAKVRKVLDNT